VFFDVSSPFVWGWQILFYLATATGGSGWLSFSYPFRDKLATIRETGAEQHIEGIVLWDTCTKIRQLGKCMIEQPHNTWSTGGCTQMELLQGTWNRISRHKDLPTALRPSATPSRFNNSMLLQLVISIFGHFVVSRFRSVSMQWIPCLASCNATIRPAGPPPTTRTGVSCSIA
jgi:hypothetical protein